MSYYDECIVEHELNKRLFPDKRLVLIVRGKVIAGFNLKNISSENLSVSDNGRITITLPPPAILSVITNPSDYETFIDRGKMKFSERQRAQEEARRILRKNALEKGILEKSEESGKLIMTSFFKSIGFKKITINVQH